MTIESRALSSERDDHPGRRFSLENEVPRVEDPAAYKLDIIKPRCEDMAGATKELVDKKVIPDCEVETRTKSIPEPVPPPEALPMQGQLGPARTVSEVLKMVSEAQKFDIGRAERLKKYLEFPMEGVYGPGVAGPALDFLK